MDHLKIPAAGPDVQRAVLLQGFCLHMRSSQAGDEPVTVSQLRAFNTTGMWHQVSTTFDQSRPVLVSITLKCQKFNFSRTDQL